MIGPAPPGLGPQPGGPARAAAVMAAAICLLLLDVTPSRALSSFRLGASLFLPPPDGPSHESGGLGSRAPVARSQAQ